MRSRTFGGGCDSHSRCAFARYAVLPTDIIKVRVRLAELYDLYTLNSELSRDHLVHALQALQQNRGASRKATTMK